jgi:hypothetical protein
VPFGVVPIVDVLGRYYYQPYKTSLNEKGQPIYKDDNYITDITSSASTLLERNALRLYPIISTDKTGPLFFWTSVEILEQQGKQPQRVGASLVNDSAKPFSPEWGMCQVLGSAETPGKLVKSFTDRNEAVPKVHVGKYSDTPWKLEHTDDGPKALLYAMREGDVFPKNWNDLLNLDCPLRIVCSTGRPRKFMADGNHYVRVWQGEPDGMIPTKSGLPRPSYPDLDIYLVPVDYQDAKNAEERHNGFQGGGPMWLEPQTDEIIGEIVRLSQQMPNSDDVE